MYSDVASPLDPYLFVASFGLNATGLVLSQFHRDQGRTLPRRQALAFSLLRKISAASVLLSLVFGFWIIGWPWIILAPVIGIIGPGLVSRFEPSKRLVNLVFLFCITGIVMSSWAQAPILKNWGLVPTLYPKLTE